MKWEEEEEEKCSQQPEDMVLNNATGRFSMRQVLGKQR